MDFGVVLRSKLEPKSTKNRSKTVSRLRCKFECIFEGSWTTLGPILEAKMRPRWGQVGAKLGPKTKRKEQVEARSRKKRSSRRICKDLQNLQGIWGLSMKKNPRSRYRGTWRACVAGLLGLAFMQGQLGQGLDKNLTEVQHSCTPAGAPDPVALRAITATVPGDVSLMC